MNRQEFKDQYRADRAAYRFVREFKEATGNYPEMLDTGISRSFDFCRLHGDRLKQPFGHSGMVTHKARMWELRRRPRLP